MSQEMHNVKQYLYSKYGARCEMCGEEFPIYELTGHHIVMKCKGGKVTVKNILLVCRDCHFYKINNIPYDSYLYWDTMYECLLHRDEKDKEKFFGS